jgi:hypothetical protein
MAQGEETRAEEEEDMVIKAEEEGTAVIKVEEGDTEDRTETEEMDPRVKVDGNHGEGMMDHLHLDDLDPGVHPEGRGIDPHHHLDVDHLVHLLGVETLHPHLDDGTTHHPEGDVRRIHHLDEPPHHEDVVMMMIPHPGVLGMIHPQLGRGGTIQPHLEVKPKKTTHPQDVVETIHHLVEQHLELVMYRDQGPDLDHPQTLHLVDAEDHLVEAEVGVALGHHRPKSEGGEVLPRPYRKKLLRMARWIRLMGMEMEMLRELKMLR